MSRGIDISHYNTCTNYSAAKAAIDWVYIKVTEGSTYVDPMVGTHYAGFAGKPRGAYHFMRGSSATEVANFVNQVRARQWELPPMLDAEYAGVTGAAIKAFLAEYQRQTGEELTVVYSSKSLFESTCNPSTFITPNTILWAARYASNSATFSTLGWDHPQLGIYQYWDSGSVPGFTAGIDVDIARINLSEDNDMTPDESRKLDEIVEQLTGSRVADQYPGWQSLKYPNDPNAKATITDYVRILDKNLLTLSEKVTALAADVAAVKAAQTAPAPAVIDLDALAAKVAALVAPAVQTGLASAVVDEEARRLQN